MPTCREPSTVRAAAWLQVWLLGLALGAALWLPGTDALGQTAGAVSLRVRSDARRTADFVKDDDGWNAYYTYTVRADGDGLKAELSSRQIVGIWKRGATVREQGFNRDGYIESLRQFAPVFLMAELTNDGQRSAQVTAAYLGVSDSATDFEPYLEIGDWARLGCGEGTYDPKFELRNLGWGEVRDARMRSAARARVRERARRRNSRRTSARSIRRPIRPSRTGCGAQG